MHPVISVIVPMFNEADNVGPLAREVIAALRGEKRSFELVLVDDASTDATWERIATEHKADSRVRGLRHERNVGQSAALWTGFRHTQSPVVLTLDGDLQNDPADFPKLLAELEKHDLVCGWRANRQDGFLRRISSGIARKARKLVLGVDFRDTGCGLRAFKRPVLDPLFSFNGFHRIMPVLAHATGANVIEIPVNHRPRAAGVSKYGMWNRLGRGIYDLLAVRWFQKRHIPPVPVTSLPPTADRP
jgi:dolichol-phosphate mannosyltransferase